MDTSQMMENFQVLLLQTEERRRQDAEEAEKRRRQEREECKQVGEEWKLSLIHIFYPIPLTDLHQKQ